MFPTARFEPNLPRSRAGVPVWLARAVDRAGIAVGVAWLLALLFQHMQLVTQPGPQEINEPGVWYATFLLDAGRNPYAFNELPGAAQFFPPFYNFVVLALKPLFGIGYAAHRMVNLLCIAGVLWLLVTRMRRLGASTGIALLSAALFYWMCLQNIMVIARPDALGLLLFLLAWLVPWERHYSRGSVAVALLCALGAFHCKAYFLLAVPPVLAGVGLVRSWREAAAWGVGFAAALAASIFALAQVFPLYWVETFVMQKNSVGANSVDPFIHSMHTAMLFARAWPYLLVVALGAAAAAKWRPSHARATLQWWRGASDPATQAEIGVAMLLAVFVAQFALVYFYMGQNGGALFTYHLHLIFPPLLLLTAVVLATRPGARVAFGALLIGFVCFTVKLRPVPDGSPGYARLRQLIEANDPVLDSLCVATEIMATHQRPVHSNGFTLFLPFATMYDRPKWDPAAKAIRVAYDRQETEATAHVERREFPLILTNDEACYFAPIETVRQNYYIAERVSLPMYFGFGTIEAWKPKPRARLAP